MSPSHGRLTAEAGPSRGCTGESARRLSRACPVPRPNREQTAGSAPKVTSALALTAREPAFARGSRRPEHPSGVSPHLSEPSLPPSLRPCREGEGGAVPPSCCERETPLAARGARGGPFQQQGARRPARAPRARSGLPSHGGKSPLLRAWRAAPAFEAPPATEPGRPGPRRGRLPSLQPPRRSEGANAQHAGRGGAPAV